uniref:NADH-ubiquinone oxidoreductase chain 1 n=1 Tax=Onchocerca volvulus TaxID=6282 RepID=A0A8R1Y0D0_ONCVO
MCDSLFVVNSAFVNDDNFSWEIFDVLDEKGYLKQMCSDDRWDYSESKYSFIGGLRAFAQSYSYEIAFSVYLLFLFVFFSFFCLVLVDSHRAPFDLFECEIELVRGFNVEYSSVGFAAFILDECGNLLYFGCLTLVFYLFYMELSKYDDVLFAGFIRQGFQSRFVVFLLMIFWISGLLFLLFSLWACVGFLFFLSNFSWLGICTFILVTFTDSFLVADVFSHWLGFLIRGVALTLHINIIFLIGHFLMLTVLDMSIFYFIFLLFIIPAELFFAFYKYYFGIFVFQTKGVLSLNVEIVVLIVNFSIMIAGPDFRLI